MKKDAFYFPHFCNARHDRKIKRVLKELGIEGYGIYFMLLEVLREQIDFKFPLNDIDLLADEFGTSDVKVDSVIRRYDLFQIDEEGNFFSLKQILYLQPYIEKTQRARTAALKRWGDVNSNRLITNINDANALQMQCDSNADAMQGKESKGKESKGDNNGEFEIWWNMYNKKTGKHKTLLRFSRLSKKEIEAIMEHTPKYIASTPDPKFRKDPLTYLNGKCWEDEIISTQPTPQQQPKKSYDPYLN